MVYKDLPENGAAHVLAEVFFPNDGDPNSRTLYVYALAFAEKHKKNPANFFSHEIGHITGLRHEFAPDREAACWSSYRTRGSHTKRVLEKERYKICSQAESAPSLHSPESSSLIQADTLSSLRSLTRLDEASRVEGRRPPPVLGFVDSREGRGTQGGTASSLLGAGPHQAARVP